MKGTVKSVEKIRTLDLGEMIDECILTIEFDEIYAYYPYNELLKYLNKEVSYVTRVDLVNGKKEQVLCEIAEINQIYTVDKTENVKLYVENNERPYCNFTVNTLKQGEFYSNSVCYVGGIEEGSSQASVHWFDLTCLDKDSKIFKLRIFANNDLNGVNQKEILEEAVGKYIQCNIRLTPYGYQTNEIEVLPWDGAALSPEVKLAEEVLLAALMKDDSLRAYVESKGLIEAIKSKIDGEPGFMLVRMASELYLIEQLGNISGDIDTKLLTRAVFCTRMYMTAKVDRWSKSVFNINQILRAPQLSSDKELLLILDVVSQEPPSPSKVAYIKIRQMVDFIVNVKRGENYEEEFINDYVSLVNRFGGLL